MLHDLEYPKGLIAVEMSLGKLYRAPLGFVNLGLARQSKIDPNERDHYTSCKASKEDRFGEVAASPNLQNLTAHGIKRRADIVCYSSQGKLTPLLIVECKAMKISIDAQEQAFGYNSALGAPFVCLAGGEEIATLWFDGKSIVRVPFLPHYRELNDAAKLFS